MATRITIENKLGKKYEFFYKTVSKQIVHIPKGIEVIECRMDVDIQSLEDIKRIRIFLDNLEGGYKRPIKNGNN